MTSTEPNLSDIFSSICSKKGVLVSVHEDGMDDKEDISQEVNKVRFY
jgi:hypothetical protein